MLLFLVRVVKVTREGTEEEKGSDMKIYFRRLRRHGLSEAAVAFGVATGVDNGVADGEGDDVEPEECVTWSEVLTGMWRLIPE